MTKFGESYDVIKMVCGRVCLFLFCYFYMSIQEKKKRFELIILRFMMHDLRSMTHVFVFY
jgi:hypothetical protein